MSSFFIEQINNLLSKDLTYLELYMKNGREIILYNPNEEDSFNSIELQEEYAVVLIKFDDGCINRNIIPYDAISYINGLYGCPKLVSSEDE